eukprot:gene6016-12128_t
MQTFIFTICFLNSCIISLICSFHWDKSDVDIRNWHITNIAEFDNITSVRDNNAAKTLLRDQRLVFIGDSLTRYQYLNLVHFLFTNIWLSPYPRNEIERDWAPYGGWGTFFKGTSSRLGCLETCDCLRVEKDLGHEVRHYHDPIYNISIHFFLWLAPRNIAGFLNIPLSNESYRDCMFGLPVKNDSKFTFNHYIFEFLDQFIRPLNPHIIIINQGIWPDNEFRNKFFFHKILQTLSEITLLPIWKTTTAIPDLNPEETKITSCTYENENFPGPECNPVDNKN